MLGCCWFPLKIELKCSGGNLILPPGCELSKSFGCQNALCIEKTPNFDLGDRQVALETRFFSADHAKQVIARFGFIISNKFMNFFQNGPFYVSLEFSYLSSSISQRNQLWFRFGVVYAISNGKSCLVNVDFPKKSDWNNKPDFDASPILNHPCTVK